AERRAGLDQRHHDAQHARRVRTAINEIAEKHSLAAVRMTQLSKIVAQAGQQGFELGTATVNVADNIEWPRILTAIAPERLPFHGGRFNLFGRMQYGYMPEPLAIESTNGVPHLLNLLPNYSLAEIAIRARPVSFAANSLGQVKDDCHWERMIFARQSHQRLACLRLNVGRIDDRELACGQ